MYYIYTQELLYTMLTLGKYSFGIGDRFSHQGGFGLEALIKAKKSLSVDFTPVWNKSNREHQIVGSTPEDTKKDADTAVKSLGFKDILRWSVVEIDENFLKINFSSF